MHLVHLPAPHLDGQEDHHQGRKPDTAGAEPEDTGASVGEQLRSSVGGDDTCQTTQARQHATDTSAVASVEKLGRRGVQNSVEILVSWSVIDMGRVERNPTVCMMYSSAFRPTYPAVFLTCVYMAMERPWQIAENTSDHFLPRRGICTEIRASAAPITPGE